MCLLYELKSCIQSDALFHPARCIAEHRLTHQFDQFHITFRSNDITEVYLYKTLLFFILQIRIIDDSKKEPNASKLSLCLFILFTKNLAPHFQLFQLQLPIIGSFSIFISCLINPLCSTLFPLVHTSRSYSTHHIILLIN